MAEASELRDRTRVRRWMVLMLGLVPAVFVALYLILLAHERLSQKAIWQARLAFLIGLEAAYGAALGSALVATPILVVLLSRARRRREDGSRLARWLLLSLSVLVGLALCETAAAVWQARERRTATLPVEGIASAEAALPLPRAPESIELPIRFPDSTDPREVNVVILGESSAEGVPYNGWLSIANLVTWQLGELIPGRTFRYDLLAMSGSNLERQHGLLAERTRRPDVLIVYCGHNEFSSRFAWSRDLPYYNDGPPPSAWDRLVARVERTSPLCGLIRALADRCRVAIPPPPDGYRALVDTPAYTRAEYDALLADFARRLERIVAYAERLGAVPVLIIPPANDSGFEPNRSFLPPETPYAEREAFAREFQAVRQLERSDPSEAITRYRALLTRQPGFAEAHYRLSRVLENAGDWEGAYRHAVEARDQDGLPMRCLSRFQQVYRDVAARHDVILIDGQAYFRALGPHGLLDDHLFHDAMHPALRGQMALAQAVLQGLHARRAFGWPEGSPVPVLDPARLAAHYKLGPGEWRYVCLIGMMVYQKLAPAHYDPAERRAKEKAYQKAANRIEAGEAPEAVGLPSIGLPPPVPTFPDADWLRPPKTARSRGVARGQS